MLPALQLKRIAAIEHRGCGVTGSMTDFAVTSVKGVR